MGNPSVAGPSTRPSIPLLLLLLLALLHPALSAGVHYNNCPNVRLFPWLARLRDSAIEHVFGRHPSKAADQPSDVAQIPPAKYANELVLRFNISTADEETTLSEAAARLFLDVWAFTDDFVDIRLHADEVAPLLGLLPQSLRSSQSTLISDLAAAVHQSLPSNGRPDTVEAEAVSQALLTPLAPEDNLFFHDYQPLPVIIRWLRLLEAMFPSYVSYVTVGKSFEGRDIPALRVGLSDLSDSDVPRKTVVVTGGLHAREWISTSTVNYLAWSFITSFGKERMIRKLLSNFDMVFMPVINPDGFEYTWKTDRLWRKSRQPTRIRFCRGLDLDHAFGFEWDDSQNQSDPCSESYGGQEPFQAVEAMQLAKWARNGTLNKVQFVAFLDLHSYSQQILFPFSSSCAVDPPNLENLEEVATGIARAIRISNGEPYAVARACEGAVAAKEPRRNKPQSRIDYQIKLRDTGTYAFLLPKEQIIPTGEEMFNAMKYLGDYLLGNNGIERDWAKEAGGDDMDSLGIGDDGASSPELRKRRVARR
ncbi:zinc carboxypeptidase domain-containing protein [Hirsutella rhossiliensis]|uniref:Inactive metallocarboxypeptidase ECM14 n=1 Tax=Hirsutella rhossiliensis TaxID=111463 RepID=A0A9P8N018_9HYPO|nr:zinc carboxypeptidase domain-containing protein [Hirsutella rhossiliensis]KAH0964420.1 zinc carboxypeptidase domain-containing protein [Hirsutella rhossiliensis]